MGRALLWLSRSRAGQRGLSGRGGGWGERGSGSNKELFLSGWPYTELQMINKKATNALHAHTCLHEARATSRETGSCLLIISNVEDGLVGILIPGQA